MADPIVPEQAAGAEEPDGDGDVETEAERQAREQEELFDALKKQLVERCTAKGFAVKETTELLEDYEFKVVTVEFPNGRETRPLSFSSSEKLKRFLALPFENLVLLGNYLAYGSYDDGYIEAAIRPLDARGLFGITRQLTGRSLTDENLEDLVLLETPHNADQAGRITVGGSSNTLFAVVGRPLPRRSLSIRIDGLSFVHHDHGVRILERVARSFFLQIDLVHQIPFDLTRYSRTRRAPRAARSDDRSILQYPKREYDQAPLSLYFYGRSAERMPLLQFLAFYQTIEYYFPVYSQAEARRKIRNILKDPTFRSDRDNDVGRIVATMQAIGNFAYGDERSQLRATILECVDPSEIRLFFESDPGRREFFSAKAKGITDTKVAINNEGADLRNDVAERIYDIRCKIVHTKSGGKDGEVELLLPFSKEADQLSPDVELIQFVAQKVLIAASSQLGI